MTDRGGPYQARFDHLAASGVNVHGEADLVSWLAGSAGLGSRRGTVLDSRLGTVLDAGCGTGRVAIELARRGWAVTGVDVDASMLATARERAPELDWRIGDLADVALAPGTFDLVVLAGNVMVFVQPGTEAAVLANLAPALTLGGLLVAGFQLAREWSISDYDRWAQAAGLVFEERWCSWHRSPWNPAADYAVSVHRRPGAPPAGVS